MNSCVFLKENRFMFLCFFEANPAHRQCRWQQVGAFVDMMKTKHWLPGNALKSTVCPFSPT